MSVDWPLERQRAEAVLAAAAGGWIGTVHEGPARVLSTPFGSEWLLPRIC